MNIERITLEPRTAVSKAKKKKLRVAAYCRVSTDTADQKTSFDGQVRTYTEMIRNKPDWKLVNIYADEGVTGTSADKRSGFQDMIADCEAGMIDLIVTKSISRFARNTLECLTYVRHLNSIGVHILFESNNIDTRTAFSEMLLTVLAAFAQEESRSISENTIWGIRKRFEEGVTRWCKLYGYEKNDNGEYQIVPQEADVVRTVFDLYEHGESLMSVAAYMERHGIPSPSGSRKWASSGIHTMLTNERYCGDILLQKFRVENHITHKAIRNDSTEVPSFYIENHHTPIISREQFRRCQTIMKMKSITQAGTGITTRSCSQYPLGDKLRCPYCGSILYQRTVKVQDYSAGWCCERRDNACHGFIMRSHLVSEALRNAYMALDMQRVAEKLTHPRFGEAAKRIMEIKAQYPTMERTDYWWVDDMIERIAFGAHSKKQEDCTMKVYWKCGLMTTVSSGVRAEKDRPAYIAKLFEEQKKRKKEAVSA